MTLDTLMTGVTPSSSFEGFATNDDFVLAVGEDIADSPGDYLVVQTGVTGHAASLNPESTDSQYLRSGKVSVKTANQRTFAVTGERYVGDDFQDFCLGLEIKFGIGQTVVRPYVYFNMLTGVGEAGTASIIVNEDQTGDAGANAGFSVDIKATTKPVAYTYAPPTP